MALETILYGIAAIITAAGGVVLVLHEFRRRDRRQMQSTVDDLSSEVSALRRDLIDCHRYAFVAADLLAEHGIDAPTAPIPHTANRDLP